MKGTLEKLRRMFIGKRGDEDDVTQSKFARSRSFKKGSMRRSARRLARKKAVVTNRGIYFVDDNQCEPDNGDQFRSPAAKGDKSGVTSDSAGTMDSESNKSQGAISYTDWIQVSDDDTLDKPDQLRKPPAERKGSRNFSLEGKSVPFDSPLPSQRTAAPAGDTAGVPQDRQAGLPPAAAARLQPAPETSTFGSSCTSGVHSMEKSRLADDLDDDLGRGGKNGGARRKAPTVVATKDNLRRSLRRLSGKRAKKSARHQDSPAVSILDDEFYRMFVKMPLVLAETPSRDARVQNPSDSQCQKPGGEVRSSLVFSRQNPITKWLEESEKLTRRSVVVSDTDRLLWSELVNYRPAEDRVSRKPTKCSGGGAKRAGRSRTPTRSVRRKGKGGRSRLEADPDPTLHAPPDPAPVHV